MPILKYFLIALSIFWVQWSWAETLSPLDQEALGKTQELLQSSSQRDELVQKDPKAKRADQMVNQLVKTQAQKDEIYRIASEIFGTMIESQNGDAEKTAELLKGAAANPEGFLRGLSSEQQEMIQKISKELEKESQAPSNP